MKPLLFNLVFLVFFSGLLSCDQSKTESPLAIKFNSKAFVSIKILNVESPIDFQFSYYPNLSIQRHKSPKYSVSSDTTIVLELIAHMPERHSLKINKTDIPFFIALEDTISLSFDSSNKAVTFFGVNKHVNDYLLAKIETHKMIRINFMKLYHKYDMPYDLVYSKLDSLTIIEKSVLDDTPIPIPNWFRLLAEQQIEYRNAHVKLSLASYRNFGKSGQADIPSDENMAFLNSLNLSSEYNQYSSQFYSFMNFYCFYLIYVDNYVESDSVTLLFNNERFATSILEEADEKGLTSGSFLAFAVDQIIGDIKQERDRRKKSIEYLASKFGDNSPALAYLTKEDSKIQAYSLKKGDRAPDFYLEDSVGGFHSMADRKGKVVLLNFYIKGCVACIKEVPYEKALLNKYGDQFEVMNICIARSKEDFLEAVAKFKFEGTNVFTQGNWREILKDKYMLSAYPHYALVDQEGMVVKNKAYKPSNPKLGEMIETLL